MQVSYNWLCEYLDLDISPQELAEKLTNGGVEVEGIEQLNPDLDDIVVGEVKEVTEHPNGDKLSVTKVDVGDASDSSELQIVCGAPNVAVGQKVPVALVGSMLPDGFIIESCSIRGERSYGMICSCEELELLSPEEEEGIMVLDDDAPIGESIVTYLELDDTILEFDLTPNRADCLGMLGVAREVAALLDIPFHEPEVTDYKQNKTLDEININIEDSNLSERYIGMLIEDINIETSPMWLQQKLRSYGIRPINNLVDITNFIMIEYGQPLHAFDYDWIKGKNISVRSAQKDEQIKTLDEKQRTLTPQDIVIADEERPIAIAGVMGGYDTEVSLNTNRILLEAASFNNISVRRTANRLNLRSEASLRFEKGVDPNNTLKAAFRAIDLIEQLDVGKVKIGAADEYPQIRECVEVELRTSRVRALTGLDISDDEIKDIFRRLDFDIDGEKSLSNTDSERGLKLTVKVPTRRNDISLEVDLIEEIARIYGYDRIPTSMPQGKITQGRKTHSQKVADISRETLLTAGFSEIISYTFISPDDFDRIKLTEDDQFRTAVPLANPMTKEQSIMRTTMIPSILKILEHNSNHGEKDFQVFEIGKVYFPKELPLKELPREQTNLIFGGMGKLTPKTWMEQPGEIDFFHLKGVFELLIERLNLNISDFDFMPEKHPSFHPTRTATIKYRGERVGLMGEIHPELASEFNLDNAVIAELNFEKIIGSANLFDSYQPLPKYPAVLRDLAVLVPEDTPEEHVAGKIADTGSGLIENIQLFDLYQGDRIPEGMKSLAYSISFRDPESTLTDEYVDNIFEEIERRLESELGAKLRKS
ncbi:phenylalanine--tRNA ligase subunit beta [Natranaerobius thermophilus]|uniref:Phenylalanine--tRNA ligase beta subunit n=1 Tax=Natranaerobius thermophilus (strain ATCC BAA-1301 / DSM 18059 / JW/NM-WN-LF) TaxID=457570 RepID=B2A5N4_NATTJ|nr:phenylalanine--tRNA ligase subunit beta [Natranaerobius thermophilus]ACB85388.1 phenylalanyl-tRNA synthetase, beta subunit [Natranaerobius thermophilus JW/NM-WN-LF]